MSRALPQATGVCGKCDKAGAKSLCSICKKTYYCGAECQQAHWKAHKGPCREATERALGNGLVSECVAGSVLRVKSYLDSAAQAGSKVKVNVNHVVQDESSADKGVFPLLGAVDGIARAKSSGASPAGWLRIIDMLIAAGANTNQVGGGGGRAESALYHACAHNVLDPIRSLLAAGADINLANSEGTTPLAIACQRGFNEVYSFLLVKGADTNKADLINGATPVFTAASNNQESAVRCLVAHGGKVTIKSNRGATPLLIAAENGHANLIPVLLSLGGDVNECDNLGATPLFMAAQMGHVHVLRALFACGGLVSINTPSTAGDTPLDVAIRHHRTDVEKLLVENGAKRSEKPLEDPAKSSSAGSIEDIDEA